MRTSFAHFACAEAGRAPLQAGAGDLGVAHVDGLLEVVSRWLTSAGAVGGETVALCPRLYLDPWAQKLQRHHMPQCCQDFMGLTCHRWRKCSDREGGYY